jgi:glycosyltransferase involved in cell wall biosynthesis
VLTRFAVVVPAHDEEGLLPDCLVALRTAAARVVAPAEVIVVADDCTDATARLAAAAGAQVVQIAAGGTEVEDRDLATRAGAAGLRVVHDSPVVTSARRAARAPAGFAAHLASVAEQVSAG